MFNKLITFLGRKIDYKLKWDSMMKHMIFKLHKSAALLRQRQRLLMKMDCKHIKHCSIVMYMAI